MLLTLPGRCLHTLWLFWSGVQFFAVHEGVDSQLDATREVLQRITTKVHRPMPRALHCPLPAHASPLALQMARLLPD